MNRWHRGKYLVPNAVTLGNMFCGFLCIIYASSQRFQQAAIAIGIAILLDGLDGRVARRLKATSKFGLEFDSFSDVVSFGLAPAFLMYRWCFVSLADEFGVTVCFVYCLCAASRLARFNIAEPDLTKFEGMPTPGAAGMVAALVNFSPNTDPSLMLVGIGTFFMLSLGFLMISKLEFFSIKRFKFQTMNKFVMVLIGALIALTWYDSGKGFVLMGLGYMFSGPTAYFMKRRKMYESGQKAA